MGKVFGFMQNVSTSRINRREMVNLRQGYLLLASSGPIAVAVGTGKAYVVRLRHYSAHQVDNPSHRVSS